MKRFAVLACTLALGTGTTALAQGSGAAPAAAAGERAAPLKVGDAAPALAVTDWVKGGEVKSFEKGKPYVVEFWATWCGPCIASMPHLSELQREYKDKGLTIIGVSARDQSNSLDAVKKMVSEKGDGMGYTVAYDADRATFKSYMTAAEQNGIPCSFVVDKTGKLAYIGHPMFLDMVLEKVVAGTWDAKADGAKVDEVQKDFFGVYQAESPADALKKIAALEKSEPKLAKQLAGMKYQAQLETGDTAGASATGRQLVDDAVKGKDAQSLNMIAWSIVSPDNEAKEKDLDLAMRAATEANKLSGEKDAAILDTLARVYFLKGDKAKAISTEEKALSNADENMKKELQATLEEYKGKN